VASKVNPSNIAAAGGTMTQDVVVGGSEFLTVIGTLGPTAAAAGDVSISVQPYLDNPNGADQGQTLSDATVPALETGTAVLANSKAQQVVRFRVSGMRKVQVVLKNNNATTALPGRVDFDLG